MLLLLFSPRSPDPGISRVWGPRAFDPHIPLDSTLISPRILGEITPGTYPDLDPWIPGSGQDPYLTRNPPLEIPLF